MFNYLYDFDIPETFKYNLCYVLELKKKQSLRYLMPDL